MLKKYCQYMKLIANIPELPGNSLTMLEVTNSHTTTVPKYIAENNSEWIELNLTDIYYISDIHLLHQINNVYPMEVDMKIIRSFIKRLVKNMFKGKLGDNIASGRNPIVLFGGDISTSFEISEIFYTEFVNCWNKIDIKNGYQTDYDKNIYAVIGNHELWDFEEVDQCIGAYRKMFDSLGIRFLYNEYEYCVNNLMIVGGVGFAGNNERYNANSGIYRSTLNREGEIKETEKWINVYTNAQNEAREYGNKLIVLTHHPISDWLPNNQMDSGCVYINGHTHQNYAEHNDSIDAHVFADNQIGYKKSEVQLKCISVYEKENPFASHEDGVHIITEEQYEQFYSYLRDPIQGTKIIERIKRQCNAEFYMVKRNQYYGFFLVAAINTYICAGGRVIRLECRKSLEKLDKEFTIMVEHFLKIFSPYRAEQERISRGVRAFGGTGKIHGCIIDIDFYNHIFLNPANGEEIFYYSPTFGIGKTYICLRDLIHNHAEELESNYLKYMNSGESEALGLMILCNSQSEGFQKIEIKNSAYAVSGKLNQMQRLFSGHVLRAWDESLFDKMYFGCTNYKGSIC